MTRMGVMHTFAHALVMAKDISESTDLHANVQGVCLSALISSIHLKSLPNAISFGSLENLL